MTTVVRHHGHGQGGPAADARRTEDDCRLQDGIYFRRDHRPGRCYRLLLLNVKRDATRPEVKESIASVWMRVQALRAELLEDLRPPRLQAPPRAPDPPKPELTCLLGFGAPLFERFPDLGSSPDLIRIETGPGPFPALARVAEADRATGEADLALQFIAESELAVSRAVVEAGMLIKQQSLGLHVAALYGGRRSKRRSPDPRKETPPGWTAGPTWGSFAWPSTSRCGEVSIAQTRSSPWEGTSRPDARSREATGVSGRFPTGAPNPRGPVHRGTGIPQLPRSIPTTSRDPAT